MFCCIAYLLQRSPNKDRNDPKSDLASPNHTANLSGPVVGCIETDVFEKNCTLCTIFAPLPCLAEKIRDREPRFGILYSCCRTLRLRRGGKNLLALHEELDLAPHLDELQRLDELRDLVAAVVDPLDAVATSATGSPPVFFLPVYHYLKFRCTGP